MPAAAKRKAPKQKAAKFEYALPYAQLDLRKHPELYRQGVGEQGSFTLSQSVS